MFRFDRNIYWIQTIRGSVSPILPPCPVAAHSMMCFPAYLVVSSSKEALWSWHGNTSPRKSPTAAASTPVFVTLHYKVASLGREDPSLNKTRKLRVQFLGTLIVSEESIVNFLDILGRPEGNPITEKTILLAEIKGIFV